MFLRLVTKSMKVRRVKILVAVLAVVMAAAMISSLLTLSFDMRDKIGKELGGYGANLVLLPDEGEYITEELKLDHPSIGSYAPYLYAMSRVNVQEVVVVGTGLAAVKEIRPWWQVEGSWPDPEDNAEALVGINLADRLGLKIGDRFRIDGIDGNDDITITVAGLLDTGAGEDTQMFLDLQEVQEIAGTKGVSMVEVRTVGDVDDAVNYLGKNNNVRVKKIRQVAETEEMLLDKTELLLGLVTLFVLVATCLGVTSTMISSVLERSREIGLMMALGAEDRGLAGIFLAEAVVIGVAGGIPGYLLGLALSQFIGLEVFSVEVTPRAIVIPVTILVSILITVAGSLIPIRKAVKIDPIITLRGE
jgi:putative ABC transport system permease protein